LFDQFPQRRQAGGAFGGGEDAFQFSDLADSVQELVNLDGYRSSA
jgi:hypothetical protein